MKSPKQDIRPRKKGNGYFGCIFALVLMIAAIFLSIKLGPHHFNHYQFKDELKQAVTRASARSTTDDAIKKDVISAAQKCNIVLTVEDIRIDRSVRARLTVEINYAIPVNFIFAKRDVKFSAKEEGVSFL